MSFDIEKMPLTPPRRRWNIRSIVVFVLGFIVLHRAFLLLFSPAPRHSLHPHVTTFPQDRGYGEMYRLSWQALTQALSEARPRTATLGHMTPLPGISVESIDQPTSIDVLQVNQADLKALQDSHAAFVAHVDAGPASLGVIYQRGTQGIVITATAEELPPVLVALRLLRRTGSTLPVEVFLLSQDDYDAKICREVFPKLDAHCAILEEYMDAAPLPPMPQSRRERAIQAQEPLHKLLAMYFSKFEDILLLDPATLVYNNPDIMLKEEPYLSTGMLIWPDFWASTVSPKLFAVQHTAEQKPNRRDNIRTVDMGQLIFSKSQHSATLLLSIYYTYYGPNLYESLLQQSSAGERGSQAIKSAARFLEAPYYMMKRHVEAVGYPDLDRADKGFRGLAMLQSFAADDFHRMPTDRHRPVFIRANNPMLHPAYIMDQGATTFKKTGRADAKKAPQKSDMGAAAAGMVKTRIASAPKAPVGNPAAAAIADGEDVDLATNVPVLPPSADDNAVHHRMWEWFGGRYMSNGWRDPDPERAVWEEMSNVACRDFADFRVWPAADTKGAQLACDRINYHRAQLGWRDFFVL